MKNNEEKRELSDSLSEYLRAKEPGKAELAGLWRIAIGLQKVDGLTPTQKYRLTAKGKNMLREVVECR